MIFYETYKQCVLQLSKIYQQREAENIVHALLEDITGLTKTERLVNKNLRLSKQQQSKLKQSLKLLLSNKPLQYVLGYAWFYGNKFQVNKHTLIPRPETEELVDMVIKKTQHTKINILDIGTGCGCIAISVKKNLPLAVVDAIDISSEAIKVAERNAQTMQAPINTIKLDFLKHEAVKILPKYDVIISNPPYIKQSEAVTMHKNVLLHEPHRALFVPENDALIFYECIAAFAQNHMNTNGCIWVEINESLAAETKAIFTQKNFVTSVIKDMQNKNRIIIAEKMKD